MTKPIEFSDFYRLLNSVKAGDKGEEEKLEWLLAEYEHAKNSSSPFDELGQIFCHIGIMEVYSYTGVDNIGFISKLEKVVWDYLEIRMGNKLSEQIIKKMKSHCEQHELVDKISKKWDFPEQELTNNVDGLAKYVADGILEVIV